MFTKHVSMAESIDTRHENWLRVAWGLLYVREGLQVRDIRNKTLHDAHYEMDGKTADDCLNKMIKVLEDRKELKYDNYAKQAAFHIRKIKIKAENTPTIMTEALHKWLQINVDVDKSLKEIECLMYDRLQKDLKGFIVAEVKRVVKHSLDDRGNDENEQKVEG
ncbi:hypothetical protein MAR_003004 [Mya arenaria]|uniref:Uncharacterized protein n=1 Tax=Mya arenaria TaxID=6604 RepID=A0ABY7G8P0_MYAAR|nr:hypothetical protein MAR_003004 [Mya arenaria]